MQMLDNSFRWFQLSNNLMKTMSAWTISWKILQKRRGSTNLPSLSRDLNGVKKLVNYNEYGQPVGVVRKKLSSYIGVLARNMVPIIYKNWHEVPTSLKEKILACVKSHFDIDPRSEKHILIAVGECWRTFKKNLTKKHIIPFKDHLEELRKPPLIYDFIEQAHWEAFVESRLLIDFQELSKLQTQRQAQNLYPHRLSRKGYAGMNEETGGISFEDMDMSQLWKKARVSKDGEFINDNVKEKAKIIDELTKKAQEGNLVINGSNDILTMALRTREHSGRVRGMGKFITPTTYFNVPRCGSKKYISELEEKQRLNEARMDDALKVIANLAKEIEKLKSGSHSTTNSEKIESNETGKILKKRKEKKRSTDKSANHSLSNMKIKNADINVENQHEYRPIKQSRNCVASSNIRKSEPCRLALGSKNIIVARGLAFDSEPNEKIHNILLGEQNVHFVVEEIFFPHQMLPITNDELTFIEDALGTHVAWPRAFVLTSTKANDNVSKSVDKQIDSSMNQQSQENESTDVGVIESFAKYVADIAQDDNQYCVPIIDEVFGTQVDVFLAPSNMVQLCNMRDLQPGLIKIYMRSQVK